MSNLIGDNFELVAQYDEQEGILYGLRHSTEGVIVCGPVELFEFTIKIVETLHCVFGSIKRHRRTFFRIQIDQSYTVLAAWSGIYT